MPSADDGCLQGGATMTDRTSDEWPFTRRGVLHSGLALAAGASLAAGPAQAQPAAAPAQVSAADYVALRLAELGCRSLFGVPGATCDPLFESAAHHGLRLVVTATDLEAGYAADGYARMRGLGAVAVTYGVGTLSLVAAIAGAYVERSPVVVINGGPSAEDLRALRDEGTLFSHGIGAAPPGSNDVLTDLAIFTRVTAKAVRIDRRADVPRLVDLALATALAEKRPVYIEIAKDVWAARVPAPTQPLRPPQPVPGSEAALARDLLRRLSEAERPVLLLGVEIGRHGLAGAVAQLTAKLQIPWATTLLAKSVLSEQGAHFAGVYDGPTAPAAVKRVVENADFVLALGCVFGRQYRSLVARSMDRMARVSEGRLKIGRSQPVAADLGRLVAAMNAAPFTPVPAHAQGRQLAGRSFAERRGPQRTAATATGQGLGQGLGYDALMLTVSDALDPSFITISDTSLSMYPAADINVPAPQGYLCNAVWQAIGYSPAAAIGVGIAEQEKPAGPGGTARRPLVICGDGGFQMTAQALSTLARHQIRAVVLVLDNALYAIEQYVVEAVKGIPPTDARSYFKTAAVPPIAHLVLPRWDYVALAGAMGVTAAAKVESAAELAQALQRFAGEQGPALIAVTMDKRSIPSELLG
jgi:indolepyruvate decarboxylase